MKSNQRPANFVAASLIALVNYMRRVGTLRFRRKYDLSLVEGWMIARLGAGAPMSMDQLATRAGLAQSQVSRAVSDLTSQGLIVRGVDRNFHREARLQLSPKGAAIYRDIMEDAPDYERRLTRGVNRKELDMLYAVLPRLIANAELNLSEETLRASRREFDETTRSRGLPVNIPRKRDIPRKRTGRQNRGRPGGSGPRKG